MPRSLQRRRLPRRCPSFRRLRANLRRPQVLVARTSAHLRDRIVFYSLLLSGLLVLAIVAWPITRAHLQAVAILQQVFGQPIPAIVRDAVAAPIAVEDVTLEVESSGDLSGLSPHTHLNAFTTRSTCCTARPATSSPPRKHSG